MPQLSSGRHVAVSISPYLDALADGPDESRYFAVVALRLHAATPEALRDHVVIAYFVEGQGTPPDAPYYNSGYSVGDVLSGRSDWTPDEIEDLRKFLDEPRMIDWLRHEFAEIDRAIRENPVWDSELVNMDSGDFEVGMIRRAIIRSSAAEPEAMAALRGKRASPASA